MLRPQDLVKGNKGEVTQTVGNTIQGLGFVGIPAVKDVTGRASRKSPVVSVCAILLAMVKLMFVSVYVCLD